SERSFDSFKLRDAAGWASDLNPTTIGPGGNAIHFVESIVTVLRFPQEGAEPIKRQAETVAATVGACLVDVRDHLAELRCCEGNPGLLRELSSVLSRYSGEWIVARGASIRIQSDNHPSEMSIIRRRTAKLIVGLAGTERSARQILKLTATAIVANLDIELAI